MMKIKKMRKMKIRMSRMMRNRKRKKMRRITQTKLESQHKSSNQPLITPQSTNLKQRKKKPNLKKTVPQDKAHHNDPFISHISQIEIIYLFFINYY